MKRGLLTVAVALGLGVTGCDKDGEGSKEPDADKLAVLEGMEAGPSGADTPQTPEEKKAAAQEAAKNLPKVQDRDPEEEKRKMAQSRQRSAQARKMLEQNKFAEAVTNARGALKIHEQNVDAMMILAEVFYREGKYELVVSVTTTALAVDEKVRTPKDTSAVYNLQGFALASLGKDQMATQAFKKAAEADDQNAAAWNNLGTRYLRAGDVNTAASCFSYAIELEPSFAKAHLNHGAALRAQGKLDEAEKAIRKAMELRKNYPEAHFNLGVLYLDAAQIREMTTSQRLSTAISELERYKQLAGGRSVTEPLATGLGSKKRIAPVSVERADDYIRLARKGIEREERTAKRKAERAEKADEEEADATSAGEEAGDDAATPDAGDDAAPAEPDGAASPAEPGGTQAPAKPGGTQAPAKPGGGAQAPAQPGGGPQAPAKPGGGPQAPAKPGGGTQAPANPAPSQPGANPQPPTNQPAQPSAPAEPSQPAPKQPSPSAPQKPSPQQPQKPGQKSASAGNPLSCMDTNLVRARCGEADASRAQHDSSSRGLGPTRVWT